MILMVFDVADIIDEAEKASPKQFMSIISKIKSILKAERSGLSRSYKVSGGLVRLPTKGEASIIGDLHGDLESLRYMLESLSPSKDGWIVFLGDYGDRGEGSPEVWYTVLRLKLDIPDLVILLRGNHEGPPDLIPFPHDLPLYFRDKFGSSMGSKIYKAIKGLFPLLYHAVLVEGKYLLVHGGLPSQAKSLADIANADDLHPLEPHLEEILWSDPRDHIRGTAPSPRGAGNLFGEDVTDQVLKIVGAKTVIRGHEPCPLGVEVVHNGKILTIFSRIGPPYYNEEAAYLPLDLKSPPLNGYELVKEAVTFHRPI